jgi:hypothetical protein
MNSVAIVAIVAMFLTFIYLNSHPSVSNATPDQVNSSSYAKTEPLK